MLKLLGLAALVGVIVPISEVRQPPEAPPCAKADKWCLTPTNVIEVSDDLAFNLTLPQPTTPWFGSDSPAAPQAIVLVSCRTDDLTGQPGRHDPAMAARGWRDLEPHIVNGELDCKRVLVPLEDSAPFQASATSDMIALTPNFGSPAQCARAGVMFASTYQDRAGWDVIAIGCPTPITDQTGKIVGWKMPDCPNKIGGLEGIRCKFDESVI